MGETPASWRAEQIERAHLLIDMNRPEMAVTLLAELIRREPGDAHAMALLGRAHLAAGDAEAATRWLDAALAADPTDGWTHHLRALALLDQELHPREAVESAQIALRQDPFQPAFMYTLVRAQLAAGDRVAAEATTARLRRVAPTSSLAPLAGALVELDQVPVLDRRRSWVPWLILVTVLTRGVGLFVFGGIWVVRAVRRAPHLRRADDLLHDALRADPGNPELQYAAAQVLDLRFRFAQSIRYGLSAATLHAGLVDLDRLASSIARRTALLIIAGHVTWVTTVAVVDEVSGDRTTVIVGVALAIAAAALVVWFDRWQVRGLPRRLRRHVHRRVPPLAAAALSAGWLLIAGAEHLWGNDTDPASGYLLACAAVAPIPIIGLVVLSARALAGSTITRGRHGSARRGRNRDGVG